MPTNDRTRERRNDARKDYITLGRDQQGADHLYRTVDETILVIHDGRIVQRQDKLALGSVDRWMAAVAEQAGWVERGYVCDPFAGIGEAAAEVAE